MIKQRDSFVNINFNVWVKKFPKFRRWIFQNSSSSYDIMCLIYYRCDIRELNHTNVESAKKDFSVKITWRNISQRIRKHCLIIVQYVIEVFKGKSQWELTFRMNMLVSMTWLSLVHCAIIVHQPWSVSGYIFSTGSLQYFFPILKYGRILAYDCESNLYVFFFIRHGIDLDNPGPNSSTSIMNSCSPGEAMPSAPLSDSGDSTGNRSADNATPPMHFLTPHVEISIPYPEQAAGQRDQSPAPLNGDSPNSPQSADSNSNAPSSSHHQLSINSTAIHRYMSFKFNEK